MVPLAVQERIKAKILDFLTKEDLFINLKTQKKLDNTLVTEIDLFICKTIKSEVMSLEEFKGYHYFSEEDHSDLNFPSLILDPIDGTKGLISGHPDCSVSLALMKNDIIDQGWGWIFNPFTGLDISSNHLFTKAPNIPEGKLMGLVSRSEWNRGQFQDVDQNKFSLAPKGSIALKLGLLAVGAADFVITKRKKQIWDIAAGSILCSARDIFLFDKKSQIKTLHSKIQEGPMLWCRKEHFDELKFLLED
jgi:myo-inositol-1(or 4)-monophosphatase